MDVNIPYNVSSAQLKLMYVVKLASTVDHTIHSGLRVCNTVSVC